MRAEVGPFLESVATSPRPIFEWRARHIGIAMGRRTVVMGVLNVTPDSFSDGGLYEAPQAAVEQAGKLLAEGADLLDIGGESSRPGAIPVSATREADRVLPVIEAITRLHPEAVLSVDTCKADVARQALEAGVAIVNDISSLGFDDKMPSLLARTGAGVVLMHMRGRPQTMQLAPPSSDICAEIQRDLGQALEVARRAGIDHSRIVLDPGIGFGKTLEDNLRILGDLGFLHGLGLPVLVGTSRKSFLGALVDRPVRDRLSATVASSVAAVLGGAHMIRVHDAAAAREAASVADAILEARTVVEP